MGGSYPYSLGIDNFTQYYSVPFNSVHRMFIAGTNRFEVAAGAVSVNTSLTTNGYINITSSGTNSFILEAGRGRTVY
jgi:outer membrane usher protein FimD/PapC